MKPNKWHALAVVAGIVLLFVLINYTILPFYKVGCCVFNGERTCGAGCSQSWDGNCESNLSLQIRNECCMSVDMCGGEVDNPSLCYHKYCTATEKYCVPGDMNTATMKYECT